MNNGNRKIFISFLGTSDYELVFYDFADETASVAVRFVQTATASKYPCEEHLIFCTKSAEDKHWNGLINEFRKHGLPVPEMIPIPEEQEEEAIWKIFDIVREAIPEKSEIVFDVTHSFRFLPLVGTILMEYLKSVTQCSLCQCCYGAWGGKGVKRAPIINLTPFFILNDWARSVYLLKQSGDASEISRLVESNNNKLMSAIKRSEKNAGEADKKLSCSLRDVSKWVSNLTLALATCRSEEITGTAVASGFRGFREDDIKKILPPFLPIYRMLKESFSQYKNGDLKNGLTATRWCMEHNLVQQGYTLLQETIVTILHEEWKKSPVKNSILARLGKNEHVRTAITRLMQGLDYNGISREEKEILLEGIPAEKRKEFKNLSQERNDINHAGVGIENHIAGRDLKDLLKRRYDALSSFFADYKQALHISGTLARPKVLIGNSFPLPLIRKDVCIIPCNKEEFPRDAEIYSFWGHQNTLGLANQFLGVDLTPKTDRPTLTLSEDLFPQLDGEVFTECWVVSPNYIEHFRAKIGEEIPAEKIKNWSILKISWNKSKP